LTGPERGFLLLTSQLGDSQRKPLTVAQLRILATRAGMMDAPAEERDLTAADLVGLGYGEEMAKHVLQLLSEEELLRYYLRQGARQSCMPLTRLTDGYPAVVRQRLGLDSPGSLWYKGDAALLNTPKIALVGSRALHPANKRFAREVGRQAARQGYTLVSGNAAGADMEAQKACLEAGGNVIAVVSHGLQEQKIQERVLYLAEDGFDRPFSAQSALSRNRVIHSLGEKTLVAQATLEKGGTWDGTVRNLRFGWSPVFCFRDDDEASRRLADQGAVLVGMDALRNLADLKNNVISFFDQ